MANQTEVIYRIIGQLESSIDNIKTDSLTCKADRKAEVAEIKGFIKELKAELGSHKKHDIIQAKKEMKHIYIAWGISGVCLLGCFWVIQENAELVDFISKLIDFIF